jgi:outer membrane lipoprotein-sorting protein
MAVNGPDEGGTKVTRLLRARWIRLSQVTWKRRGFGLVVSDKRKPTYPASKNSMSFLRIRGRVFFVLLLGCGLAFTQQIETLPAGRSSAAPLSAQQVANNLQARDAERAAALKQFTCRRIYHMQYRGFAGTYEAQMVVDMTYSAPNVKQFKVVSQSGSTFVVDHIFRRLMASEQEFISDDNRQQTALDTENYDFTLAGYEVTPKGAQYVLNIIPKKKNRFLYRGKIWVDANDFAVLRIEAAPSQNPSIWIKKTEIQHQYMKVNDFWLPAADHTESEIRLGGEANLSIDYTNYRITNSSPVRVQRARADSN